MTQTREESRIPDRTRVRTTKEDPEAARLYDGPREGLRWGVEGTVITSSGGHGLCYYVSHGDGTPSAWYEPTELEVIE